MNIMLDECVTDPRLYEALDQLKSLNICTIFDCGFPQGGGDDALVFRGTRKYGRLLFTKNIEDINEHYYPPCNHGGIIVFHEQELTPEYVVPRIKALWLFRLTRKVVGHVTKIYDDKIEVITHKERIEKKFNENERVQNIIRGR